MGQGFKPLGGAFGVEAGLQARELGFVKRIAQPHRVAAFVEGIPCAGQTLAEVLECLMPLGVGQDRGPHPLNAERGFAPAGG